MTCAQRVAEHPGEGVRLGIGRCSVQMHPSLMPEYLHRLVAFGTCVARTRAAFF